MGEPRLGTMDEICVERTSKFSVIGVRSREEVHLTPDWLLSPTLSGSYEMAPEAILRYQTGWGRAVFYEHGLRRLAPTWSAFASGSAAIERARVLELPAVIDGAARACRVFEFAPRRSRAAVMRREALGALAAERRARPLGLSVSNTHHQRHRAMVMPSEVLGTRAGLLLRRRIRHTGQPRTMEPLPPGLM